MQRRLNQMNRAFPRAMVSGYEHLEPQMQADEKDKHVLAAAVHSESTALVTENVKDFHPPTTGPHAMPVQRLSPFLNQVVDDNPQRAVAAMRQMISRTGREPNTMPGLIDKLAAQQDLRGFAQKLNSVVPAEERGSHPALEQGKTAQSVAFDGVPSAAGAAQKPESTPTATQHGGQVQEKGKSTEHEV